MKIYVPKQWTFWYNDNFNKTFLTTEAVAEKLLKISQKLQRNSPRRCLLLTKDSLTGDFKFGKILQSSYVV